MSDITQDAVTISSESEQDVRKAREEALNKLISTRLNESRNNFTTYARDRFDLFYKNYRSYSGDRLEKLKKAGGADWMSNMFVPMTASHIRAIHPRVISAKPEMRVEGRNAVDTKKALYAQGILEYLWEKSDMDSKMRDFTWQALVYGTTVGKILWNRERRAKTDKVVDEDEMKITDVVAEEELYNDPDFEVVDLYNFWPDPLATSLNDARYLIQRYLMTKEQILTTYGDLNDNANLIGEKSGGDTTDYATVRNLVAAQDNLDTNTLTNPVANVGITKPEISKNVHEVIEYWEKNRFVLQVDGMICREGENPFGIPEYPFILVRFETLPFEFYGIGISEQLEQPQKTLNIIRNQRIDNVTLGIQKMFIANPFALISPKDLVARPYGIVRTTDPNGVRPLEVPEVKSSAFDEDALTQEAGRMATGIDDWSRGIQGPASATATSVSTQKESTLERVKLFVKTLESECYEKLARYWLRMAAELYPEETIERIVDFGTGETQEVSGINRPITINVKGELLKAFALKSDLLGNFDIKVLALSTLAATKELQIQKLLDLMDKAVVAGRDPVTNQMIPDMRELWRQLMLAYNFDPSVMLLPPGKGNLTLPEGGAINGGAVVNSEGEPTTTVPSKNEILNNINQKIAGIGVLGTQGGSSERATPLPAQGKVLQAALQTSK